jgi:hypothetical protein
VIQLLIVALSLPTLALVHFLFTAPSSPTQRAPFIPTFLDIPDATLDITGLT